MRVNKLVSMTVYLHLCLCALYFLQIERRMENVRSVSHNVHKKMQLCLQGQAGADVDKRHVRPKDRQLTGLLY